MKSLSIALVLHGWPASQFGGVGLYVLSLAEALHQLNHTVTIISPQTAKKYDRRETSFSWGTHISISMPAAKNWKETWLREDTYLKAQLSHYFFDAIHIHHLGNWPLNLPNLLRAKYRFLTLHDYAIMCIRGQLYHPHQGICSGPSSALCSSCIQHQLAYNPFVHFLSQKISASWKERIKKKLFQKPNSRHNNLVQQRINMGKQCLHTFNRILSPSYDLIQRFSPFTQSPITYNALPLLSHFPSSQSPPLPFCFVFASSIIPTKGLHLVLDAIEKMPNVRLLVAGTGFSFDGWPDYEKQQVQRCYEYSNVEYLGAISHEKMASVLAQAHCLVLPSLWPENSPIIIREALSMGLQVICSEEGGAKELSKRIHTISPHDHHSLLKMMKTLSNSPPTRHTHKFLTMEEHASRLSLLYLRNTFVN